MTSSSVDDGLKKESDDTQNSLTSASGQAPYTPKLTSKSLPKLGRVTVPSSDPPMTGQADPANAYRRLTFHGQPPAQLYQSSFHIPSNPTHLVVPPNPSDLASPAFLIFSRNVLSIIQSTLFCWPQIQSADVLTQLSFRLFTSAMSNTVYSVSPLHPDSEDPKSMILRIYGPGEPHKETEPVAEERENVCISQPFLSPELHPSSYVHEDGCITPTKLSLSSPAYFGHFLESLWMALLAKEHVSPYVYANFANGRLEQYMDNYDTMNAKTIRVPFLSTSIASQLANLHQSTPAIRKLTLQLYNECYPSGRASHLVNEDLDYWSIIMRSFRHLKSSLLVGNPNNKAILEEHRFFSLYNVIPALEYILVQNAPPSIHVFSHMDLQYGNLMSIKGLQPSNGNPVIFIDYEYGCFGPRALDIANHFFEWMMDYDQDTSNSYKADLASYPTWDEIASFVKAYIRELLRLGKLTNSLWVVSEDLSENSIDNWISVNKEAILYELDILTMVSDLKWAFWGMLQYEQRKKTASLVTSTEIVGFSYLDYAWMRLDHFWSLQARMNSHGSFPLSRLFTLAMQ